MSLCPVYFIHHLKQRNFYCKNHFQCARQHPLNDMGTKLKPIEKIGINRGIMIIDRLCVVKDVNENSSIVEYINGDKETIKFGTLIDPLEAPIILVFWNTDELTNHLHLKEVKSYLNANKAEDYEVTGLSRKCVLSCHFLKVCRPVWNY